MKRASVIDFLGVVRVLGCAVALVMAPIAGAVLLACHDRPHVGPVVAMLLVPVVCGLLVALIAGLSRVLVRRMRFASPQD